MELSWLGETLHYTDEGATDDAILFLHGLGGNANNWLHQRRAFAEHHRVITLDFPGHGRSTGTSVPFGQYAAAAQALLDHLRVNEVSVVGLAMGARVGITLAARSPRCVRRLTIVNGYLELPPREHEKRVELYDLLLSPGGAREWAQLLLEGMGVSGHAGIARGFLASADRIDPAHVNAVFHQVDGVDQAEEFRGLAIPVQLIVGERDQLVPTSSTEQLTALARKATISRFPDSGHLPYLEDPATFNRALEDFLHGQAASTDGAT
ncbi:alpha/beta hydrolase [Actinacidiphila glaucinigra]|uniref:alpha/beta fold hydrolase n=1 Tax=Streptomycetaceae TaxID=2062 RepID=UPI002DDB6C2F|nr:MULTISPECIES: alpha/beta hydrolase [Streptomycetaceae]WSD57497.1 alpha/beta hydrolase [Actinacidiphila glaucinigra]WSD65148.1 alpha/beta hydrolase [Actinacidiphila glaucinigra]WUB50279.1 alpha/beta hydrolase [Streptomyces griseorubiginosus]